MSGKFMQAVAKSIDKRGTAGLLHDKLGVSRDKPIPTELLDRKAAELHDKAAGDKKLNVADAKLAHEIQFARNAR